MTFGHLTAAAGVFAALALVACAPPLDRAPPSEPFEANGATYRWGLAHGITGSLSLERVRPGGRGLPELIMTCAGTAQGGLQIRGTEAGAGPLSVTAGGHSFHVWSARYDMGGVRAFQGAGALPPGWFDALADASTVRVNHGPEAFEIKGPGRAAVGHYRRYCETLDREA